MFVSAVSMTSCEKDDIVAKLELECTVTSTNVTTFDGNDGTITVTVKKGNGGYEFYLNDELFTNGNFTELEAGTYNVKVIDKEDKVFTQSVTITQPDADALEVHVTSTNVTTFDGSDGTITLTVTSGYKPFKYSLNDNDETSDELTHMFSNLTNGTYSVKVTDALSREFTQSVIIIQPNQLVITTTPTHVKCFGGNDGSIVVTATGETEPYTYKINSGTYGSVNTFSVLSAGTYTVWVKSANGVTDSKSVTITQPPTELSFTTVTTAPTTQGGSGTITVTATGGTSPYTYQLNTGSFGSNNVLSAPAGTHTVTVKDANVCTKTTTGIVVNPFVASAPTINSFNVTGSLINGNATFTANVSGNGSNSTFVVKCGTSSSNLNISSGSPTTSNNSVNLTFTVTGLNTNTIYHFVVEGTNDGGTTTSVSKSFRSVIKVGDVSDDGIGVVFNVTGTWPNQSVLMVKKTDESGTYTWDQAMNISNGDWRLPTGWKGHYDNLNYGEVVQLHNVLNQLDEVSGFNFSKDITRWTSFDNATKAGAYYIDSFDNDKLEIIQIEKNILRTVRLVKSFTTSTGK